MGFESRLKQKEDLTTDLERQPSFFRGEYYYNRQTYLLFETRSGSFNYTKSIGKSNKWLSTGIHNENGIDLVGVTNLLSDPSKSTLPELTNDNNRLHITFKGNYFKQDKIDYFHKSEVNIYIVYELENRRLFSPDCTAQNCLFGAAKITKDTDPDHNKYVGYGICFDAKGSFSFVDGNNARNDAKNVIILGVDMAPYYPSTSLPKEQKYTKKNNIYVLGKTFIQSFSTDGGGHTIDKQKLYKTNMTEPGKKFVVSLHYNGDDSYLFVNGVEELKFKTATNQINSRVLLTLGNLGNISADWNIKNSAKTGLFGKVYDLVVDYVPISGVKNIQHSQGFNEKT